MYLLGLLRRPVPHAILIALETATRSLARLQPMLSSSISSSRSASAA